MAGDRVARVTLTRCRSSCAMRRNASGLPMQGSRLGPVLVVARVHSDGVAALGSQMWEMVAFFLG